MTRRNYEFDGFNDAMPEEKLSCYHCSTYVTRKPYAVGRESDAGSGSGEPSVRTITKESLN
jgi:hypothetical protein